MSSFYFHPGGYSGGSYGTGVSAFTASGINEKEVSRTGTGISARVASGTNEKNVARSNTAVAPFTVLGNVGFIRTKSGIAEKVHTGTGDGRWTITKVGQPAFAFQHPGHVHGRNQIASGTNNKTVARRNTAKAPFTAQGRQGDSVLGKGVTAFVGSGAITEKVANKFNDSPYYFGNNDSLRHFNIASGTSDLVMTETGFTVRGLSSSGDSRITYVETGAGISARTASGMPSKIGTASAPFTGTGSNELVYSETGTAVSEFSAHGFAQPAGVTVIEFTGGGYLKSLYANDNFAGRELIDSPTGDLEIDDGPRSWLLAGATGRATNESGEDLTIGAFISRTKTLWWELQVPFPCIVHLDAYAVGTTLTAPRGYAQKGTAVNATFAYASVDDHFGEVDGTGYDGNRTGTGDANDFSGAFPYVFSPYNEQPAVLQVDPSVPLVFSVGKDATTAFEFDYVVSVERLDPPENDGPDSAYELDIGGGSVDYDATAATGDKRWNWDQLNAYMDSPNAFRLGGDLFYAFRPEEDGVFRFDVTQDVSGARVNAMFFEGTDFDTWVPMQLGADIATYPYAVVAANTGDINTAYEVEVEAGKSYTLALLTMRSVTYFGEPLNTYFSASPTPRGAGTLTWTFLTAAPTNDDFADRLVLLGAPPIVVGADTRASTEEEGEPEQYADTAVGVWYEYTPSTTGWYTLYLDDAITNLTKWDVFRVAPAATPSFEELQRVSGDRDIQPLFLRAGDTYYIRLTVISGGKLDHGNATLSLAVTSALSNDDFADRISISGDSGDLVVDTNGASTEFDEPITYWWNPGQMPSVWYEWTPPYTGAFSFRVTAGYADVRVYTGSALSSLVPVCSYSSYDFVELQFNAQAGMPHQIQLGTFSGVIPDDSWALSWRPETAATNTSSVTAIEVFSDGVTTSGNNGTSPALFVDTFPDPFTDDIDGEEATLEEALEAYFFDDDIESGRALWYKIVPEFNGTYFLTWRTTNWQAGMMVLDADLHPIENSNGDLAIEDTSWYDGFDGGDDYPLRAGETYYLVVFGWNGLTNNLTNADFEDDPYGAQLTDDMMPQGDFSFSWVAVNTGDEFNSIFDFPDVDLFNLNFHEHYSWYSTDPFTETGPVWAENSGGCRLSSNIGATAESGEPAHYPGWPATSTVWFSYTVGGAGTYQFWIEPDGPVPIQDPVMAVYNRPFPQTFAALGTPLAQGDDFGGPYPTVTVGGLESSQDLVIAVDGRDQGTFELKWRRVPDDPPPANDDFANAEVVTEELLIAGTTRGSTVECDETPVAGWYAGPFGSVWYVYNPVQDGTAFLNVTVDATDNDWDLLVDVFQGTTIANLSNITPADDYNNGSTDGTFGFPFSFIGGVPVYIRLSTYYDGMDDTSFPGTGSDFSFTLNVGSTTPPDNDEPGGATDAGGGTTSGNNDGAGYTPGEPDPIDGGTLEENDPSGGTTWHKYVPDAPGFVDIYATTSGVSSSWPAIGVWEGASAQTGKLVSAIAQDPNRYPYSAMNGAHPCHFEVRQDQTYWIQVIRRGDQPWGAYDLHIDEYLEYNDWSLINDGFTSTTGGITVNGDTITMSGSQAVGDVLDVLPQYGTIDLGSDTPKWGREVRIYFETRIVGGQALWREHWYGKDDWSFANASVDDHVNFTMRRLGFFRARDTAGNHSLVGSLAPNTNGTNTIAFDAGRIGVAATSFASDVSLGQGAEAHDDGWVSVEVICTAANTQNNTSTSDPGWTVRAIVDGKPVDGSCGYSGKQLRYIDFGMYRHPSMQGPDTVKSDQRYAENNEAWTYEMRRLRVRNIMPQDPYGVQFADDAGVYEFDGFASGAGWKYEGNRHWSASGVNTSNKVELSDARVVDFPDKPGWSGIHPTNLDPFTVSYGLATGCRRWYGFTLRADDVGGTINVAQYLAEIPLAWFRLDGAGELTITPFNHQQCVAHPTMGEAYFIECHVNSEVMWDVQCTVYIEGVSFGTYDNAVSWSEQAAGGKTVTRKYPAFANFYSQLTFGDTGFQEYDLYMTNLVAAHGHPDAAVGPLQTESVPATIDALPHNLPGVPETEDDKMDLYKSGVHYQRLYGWLYEDTDPGPLNGAVDANGSIDIPMPVFAPRFWETHFTLRATNAWLEEGAWSGVGQGLTRIEDHEAITASAPTGILKLTHFGESVPVDANVTGIQVSVWRRGAGVTDDTVQLYKGGVLVGSNKASGAWASDWEVVHYGDAGDSWGTTWTPQEVNALGFGVGIAAGGGGTAEIDKVEIRVWLTDQGGPEGIGRGTILDPSGLFNLYGDDVVVEMTYSGAANAGISWPTGGWEPGGQSGTSGSQKWSSLNVLWLWQARGDKRPSLVLTGTPGLTGSATDMRIVRDPLVYPRYAWSADDGATYTWVEPGETESAAHIGDDVSVSGTDAVFLDNAAALVRFQSDKGGWSAGLSEDRPTSSRAYRYAYWYLTFIGDDTTEDTVFSANLRARWRPYSNAPSTILGTNSNWLAAAALPDGSVKRIGRFTSGASTTVGRFTLPRMPGGAGWTPEMFNDLQLRLGLNDNTVAGSFSLVNDQGRGACLYAASWEILIPAPPTQPPSPCAQLIDLSMMRYPPGAGDPDTETVSEGTDLSDVRFMPGAEVTSVEDLSGTDLADVLFFPGASAEES